MLTKVGAKCNGLNLHPYVNYHLGPPSHYPKSWKSTSSICIHSTCPITTHFKILAMLPKWHRTCTYYEDICIVCTCPQICRHIGCYWGITNCHLIIVTLVSTTQWHEIQPYMHIIPSLSFIGSSWSPCHDFGVCLLEIYFLHSIFVVLLSSWSHWHYTSLIIYITGLLSLQGESLYFTYVFWAYQYCLDHSLRILSLCIFYLWLSITDFVSIWFLWRWKHQRMDLTKVGLQIATPTFFVVSLRASS